VRLVIVLSTIVLCACGSSAVRAPRFALMPAAWRTRDPWPGLEERAMLRRGLSGLRVDDVEPIDGCEDDEASCARRAGGDADRVIVTTMASLGDTVLARVNVIETRGAAGQETRQRVIEGANEARVRTAMVELGRAIAEPYVRTPWYEEWWPWTIAGVLVAGVAAAITGAVLATQDNPDWIIEP
jgi:hypothetical protein